ncbi:hypothetical protein OXPF_12060 [Oxobacter pfennigii]|uniref:UPF0033 domain-containing protein n=1 Tax=Oxobacter pfennigii TaxID=36849 RepID=A0A0P8YZK7_9CLOT|nr:sulfurtransferase TusA family protein [Oxobacter pfennigii]KPU45313.1 hypothetical protein OXPF_12060 [Oxobacter pfennigii]
MIEVDCLGEICPVPIIRIKENLKSMKSGDSIKVVTDHSCTQQSVMDFFKNKKFKVQCEEVINGVWEITVIKG